jgi:tryptophan synthase beta chain
MRPDQIILVNLSGRGDKDVRQVSEMVARGELRLPPVRKA